MICKSKTKTITRDGEKRVSQMFHIKLFYAAVRREEGFEFKGYSICLFPNNYFFIFHLLTLLSPFLSDCMGDTKTMRPFAFKGHGWRTMGTWLGLIVINNKID